ncbi:hypothetical protein CAPTEDRAFT_52595, partial [Capitella teleta]
RYTNDFVVEIEGDGDVADLVAASHGFKYVRQLHSLGEIYHFTHEEVSSRSKRSARDLVARLAADPNVGQMQPHLHNYISVKNSIPEARWTNQMHFNDPFYRDQWYYDNKGQTGGSPGIDLNVIPVWKKGLTGRGVVVTILDDGVDHTHPDLRENYLAEASADLNSRSDNDPMPDTSSADNSHGTRCAGEVAAKADNGKCGVGIAYNANIGGVRMLDGLVTDMLESEAISFKRDLIDIYSASWGPPDTGDTMEGPGVYCKRALADGVRLGRNGKGSIFVWATGNGGMVDDDCNCDGYVSSIETISIGSMSDRGLSTYFSEVCLSTMAVVPCGGDHTITARRESDEKPHVTTDLNGDCTLDFEGTSSAAPMAAGAFALVLEANPDLTWRDLQHLVARTARIPNDSEEGWTVNGGGLHVNPRFGFGVIDVGLMVEEAQKWKNVAPQKRCDLPASNTAQCVQDISSSIMQKMTTDGCAGVQQTRVTHLEHVQVQVKVKHPRRGDITMTLTSPSGTESTILKPRPLDNSAEGIDFTFLTVHHWAEDPSGEWTLAVKDIGTKRGQSRGRLLQWSLTLWGSDSEDQVEESPRAGAAHNAEQNEISKVMNIEEDLSNSLN